MRQLFFIAVIVACTGTLSAQDVLRLDDAVAISLQHNHRIRIAKNSREIAANNTTRGTANFLPTLDASGNWSLARSEQETNSPFSFGNSDTRNLTAQLALNWTLFDGFRMFGEAARYNELARLGLTQERSVIEQTVVSTVTAYMNVVRQVMLLDMLERTLSISRTRFAKEEVRHELGGSATDYLNAQIAYNTDSAAVLDQRLQLSIAQQDLNLLLGRASATAFTVDRDVVPPGMPDDMDELRRAARQRNADLLVARQNLAVAEAETGTARSSFFPRISLFANYGYGDRITSTDESERFTDDISTQSTDATVGLSFSFNLFNGFRNSTDVQNAVLARRSAESALKEREQQLDADFDALLSTLRTRLASLSLMEHSLDAARKNLDLQLQRYETGTVTSLEFRDAQLQFIRAESAYILALFEARIASLQLQRLSGDIRLSP